MLTRGNKLLGWATLLFMLVTAVSYFVRSDCHGIGQVQDGVKRLGFPLLFWEAGGFGYREFFSVAASIVDFALTVGSQFVFIELFPHARNAWKRLRNTDAANGEEIPSAKTN